MPQPRSFHSDSSSNAPALPPGGMTLTQSRGSDSWRSDEISVHLAIDLPATVFSQPTRGELIAGVERWQVTLERAGEALRLVVLQPSGEVLSEGIFPFSPYGKILSTLSGARLEVKAWHARQGIWIEGKPVAIWWDAWRDEDVDKKIRRFLWVDPTARPNDWPVLVAIVTQSSRIVDSAPSF